MGVYIDVSGRILLASPLSVITWFEALFDVLDSDWEAPGSYYLACMAVYSIIAYIILTLRQRAEP
jgi:hypothetical protein